MKCNDSPKLLWPCLGLLGLCMHYIEFICVSDPRASEIHARDNEKVFQKLEVQENCKWDIALGKKFVKTHVIPNHRCILTECRGK